MRLCTILPQLIRKGKDRLKPTYTAHKYVYRFQTTQKSKTRKGLGVNRGRDFD